MKESLFDILNSHPNWEADIMEPATNREACAALDKEIKQAAALYADSLLPLADRWQKAVENDIYQIFTREPPHTHFNKDRQERYKLTVDYFIGAVKQALKSHGFDISQLDRVTQWRLGENLGGWPGSNTQIQDGLSKDEAGRLLHKMSKQGYRAQYFRELCSNLYTVLAYKDEASQTMKPRTPPPAAGQMGKAGQEPEADTLPPPNTDKLKELKEEWSKGKAKAILIRLEKKEIIKPKGDAYEWKIDSEHGYGLNLYIYFVLMASEKLGWMEGKEQDRVPWRKFAPMFPNVSANQNSRGQDLRVIRQAQSLPTLASIIDEVLNW